MTPMPAIVHGAVGHWTNSPTGSRMQERVVLQSCTYPRMSARLILSLERSGDGPLIPVRCLYRQSEQVIKGDKTDPGKWRYRCHTPACSHQSYLLNSASKGRSPEITQQVIELRLNGSGVRDTAWVLGISPPTVIKELKKRVMLSK